MLIWCSPIVIGENCRIGDGCIIQASRGEVGLQIPSNTFIEENSYVSSGGIKRFQRTLAPHGIVEIDSYATLKKRLSSSDQWSPELEALFPIYLSPNLSWHFDEHCFVNRMARIGGSGTFLLGRRSMVGFANISIVDGSTLVVEPDVRISAKSTVTVEKSGECLTIGEGALIEPGAVITSCVPRDTIARSDGSFEKIRTTFDGDVPAEWLSWQHRSELFRDFLSRRNAQ